MNTQPLTGLFRAQKVLSGHREPLVVCPCCGDSMESGEMIKLGDYPGIERELRRQYEGPVCHFCADQHHRCCHCNRVRHISHMVETAYDGPICADELDDFEAECAQAAADMFSNIADGRAWQ